MPAEYTSIFAKYLCKASGVKVWEVYDGQELLPGNIYLASGNRHLGIEQGAFLRLRTYNTPPENHYRPSIDHLYRSLAPLKNVLGILLTGMGNDGLRGAHEIVKNGGAIMAQDFESSVVWGMPGAVVQANLCSAVESPQGIRRLLDQLHHNFGRLA